jgi:hypothetical protein
VWIPRISGGERGYVYPRSPPESTFHYPGLFCKKNVVFFLAGREVDG